MSSEKVVKLAKKRALLHPEQTNPSGGGRVQVYSEARLLPTWQMHHSNFNANFLSLTRLFVQTRLHQAP